MEEFALVQEIAPSFTQMTIEEFALVQNHNPSFSKLSNAYKVPMDEMMVVHSIFEGLPSFAGSPSIEDQLKEMAPDVAFLFEYGFTLADIAKQANISPDEADIALRHSGKKSYLESLHWSPDYLERFDRYMFVTEFYKLIGGDSYEH